MSGEVDVAHMEVFVGQFHLLDSQQRAVLQIQTVPHLSVRAFADQMPLLPFHFVALSTIDTHMRRYHVAVR